jgi:hypothetical protein
MLGRWKHLLHGLDIRLVVVADHQCGPPAGAGERLPEEGGGGLGVSVLSEEDISITLVAESGWLIDQRTASKITWAGQR